MKRLFFPALILILCFFALKSLFSVPFYTSHDGFTHTARIAAYYNAVKDGVFPAQWAKNLNGNLGSPIFIYSYPLVYMIGTGLHYVGINYQDAFKLILGGGYLLSGLAMYWWLKSRFGKPAAFLGAVFYLWTPYRFLDIYVRGAFAENFAFIFMPLILWAIDKNKWVFLTLSTTGLLLSHNVVSAMFLPVVGLWALISKKSWKVFWCVLLAFGISAFIYLPDFFERQYIAFDKGISYWADHFVYFQQFLRSRWDYGFDMPGMINDAMSFELGLANWLTLGLLTIFVLIKRKADKFVIFFILLFALVVLVAIYNPFSTFIWQNTPVMKTIIDFPWRWFGFLALIMAYLGAYLVKNTSKILIIFLLAAILIANRNHLRVNESVTFSDEVYDNYSGTATATSNEYTPVWHKSPTFIPGDLTVIPGKFTANTYEFKVETNTSGIAVIKRFYFPETTIYRSGQKLTMNIDWQIDDFGTIKLNVASPGGNFVLRQGETDLRKGANYLSLFGLLLIAGIFYVIKKS